jgi:hypothetical protein
VAKNSGDALYRATIIRYVIATVTTVALAGCAGSEPATDHPYRADFEAASGQATSDFERGVLGDFEISRAEYEEAVDRYVRCASDLGVQLSAVPQGGYYVFEHVAASTSAAQSVDGVVRQCRAGTIDLIEPLYVGLLTNPNKEDRDQLVVACFIDKGLAPEGYTVEEFRGDRGSGQEQRPPDFPFDEQDPRFIECMVNPSR